MPNPARLHHTLTLVRASTVDGPRTRSALIEEGITSDQLRAAHAAGLLTPIHRGTWMPVDQWTGAEPITKLRFTAQSAQLSYPDSVVSHSTAAALLGLPDFGAAVAPDELPIVHLCRKGTRLRRDRIIVHDREVDGFEHLGVGMTDPLTTAIDVALRLSPARALSMLDAGLRMVLSADLDSVHSRSLLADPRTPDRARAVLRRRLNERPGLAGLKKVRSLAQLVNPAAESVFESMSRWNMRRAHLPEPRCGVPIETHDGSIFWVDFCWDRERVIGEADGLSKYECRADLIAEKRRQELLERAGWRVVRWNWFEGVTQPAIMQGLLHDALRRRPRAA